jgi:hypothetical protein
LKVAVGVCFEREMLGLGEWRATLYAPRYLARYYYMDSGAAALLLDPLGQRRTPSSAMTYPMVVTEARDGQGRQSWAQPQRVPKFPYFVPVVVRPADGESLSPAGRPGQAYVYEAGRHAHGSRSDAEHWFCEDWILFRWRSGKADERILFDWGSPTAPRKNCPASSLAGARCRRRSNPPLRRRGRTAARSCPTWNRDPELLPHAVVEPTTAPPKARMLLVSFCQAVCPVPQEIGVETGRGGCHHAAHRWTPTS